MVAAMDIASILFFAAVVGVAMATPGPTMVALVARVLAGGRRGNAAFGAGLILGDIVWLGAAVFGVAAIATWLHEVMVVLKWAGAAYLVYLAWRLWTAPAALPGAAAARPVARPWREALGGLTLAVSNPKTMMFYIALLPNLVDMRRIDAGTFLELAAVMVVVYAAVLAGYILCADRARRWFVSRAVMRAVNRGCAALMAGAAAAVASR
jgi:threonine/homoserine/homoserine lactone efflux protein